MSMIFKYAGSFIRRRQLLKSYPAVDALKINSSLTFLSVLLIISKEEASLINSTWLTSSFKIS